MMAVSACQQLRRSFYVCVFTMMHVCVLVWWQFMFYCASVLHYRTLV